MSNERQLYTLDVNKEKGVIFQNFQSWSDLIEEANRPNTSGYKRSSRTGGRSFTDTDSFEQASSLAISGWKEGTKRINDLAGVFYDNISSLILQDDYVFVEDGGFDYDTARLIEGEPCFWLNKTQHVAEGFGRNILRLKFNICCSAGISTEVMVKRGAVAAALVVLLERAGFGVEVILADTIGTHGRGARGCMILDTSVLLKRAEEELDVMALAFALAHPSSLRRIFFGQKENLDKDILDGFNIRPNGGYGSVNESIDQCDIYLGSAKLGDRQWVTEEDTRNWIIEQLKLQGVQL